jgi:hypothetical protein
MMSSGVALTRSPAGRSSPLARPTALAKWRALRADLRTTIQRARARGLVTPEVVAAFAMLHMQTDDGLPIVPADHHWLWLRLICDMDIKRLLIIATPESAKTTWMMAYMACMIGFHPEWPGIIAAVSGPVAEKRSLALRLLVESAEFRETFPTVLPAVGMTWRTDEWSVAENGEPHAGRLHPTVSAYGTGGSVTGSRARWLIADDILDNDNTRTQHQRMLVDDWLHKSLLSRLMAQTGRAVVISNAWHHDDPVARLRRNEGWVTCHTPLLTAGTEVVAHLSYPDDFAGRPIGMAVSGPEVVA